MAGKATAVDPGSHTIKVLGLKDGKHGLEVTSFAAVPAKQGAQGLAATVFYFVITATKKSWLRAIN